MHHLLAFSTAYRTQLPSKFSHTHPVTHRARSVSIVICLIAATSSTPLHRWHSVDEAPLQRHFFTAAAVLSPPPPLHTAVSPPPRSVHRVHSIRLRSPRAGSTPPLHRLHVTAAVSSPPQPPRFRHHCLALVPSILPISSHYQFFTAAVLASPPKSLHRRSLFTVVISLHCHHIPSTHDYHFLQPSLLLAVFSPPSLRHTATTATPLHHSPLSPRITARPCHSRHLSSPPPSLHCHHSTTDRSLLKQRQRRSRRRCRSRSRPRHPRPHHHNRRQLRRHGSCRRFGRCQTAVTSSPPLSLHRHTRPSLLHCPPTLLFTAGPSRHFHHLSTTSLR